MKHTVPFRFSIGPKILVTLVVLNLCAFERAGGQELLGKYEAQYQTETDLVQKAKLLAKLGPLEIEKARKRMDDDQDEQSLAVLEHYRDDVRQVVTSLGSAGIDAVKHPAGFKELQMGLRETLRRFDDFIVAVPVDKRPWFRAVRGDLSDTENSLLDSLFPTPAEKNPKKAKSQ